MEANSQLFELLSCLMEHGTWNFKTWNYYRRDLETTQKANLKGKVFQPVIWKSVKNEYEKLAKIKTKYSNLWDSKVCKVCLSKYSNLQYMQSKRTWKHSIIGYSSTVSEKKSKVFLNYFNLLFGRVCKVMELEAIAF